MLRREGDSVPSEDARTGRQPLLATRSVLEAMACLAEAYDEVSASLAQKKQNTPKQAMPTATRASSHGPNDWVMRV